jgi:hypothetical protein
MPRSRGRSTRLRSDLQREIAALATEVRELVRQRIGSLPGTSKWVQVMVALTGGDEIQTISRAFDLTGPRAIAEYVERMRIAPAAEAVRAGLLRAVACAARGDLTSYRAATKALQPTVEALLALMGDKWRSDMAAAFGRVDLYRCALEWESYAETERPAYIPPRSECTDGLVLAALAVRRAADQARDDGMTTQDGYTTD